MSEQVFVHVTFTLPRTHKEYGEGTPVDLGEFEPDELPGLFEKGFLVEGPVLVSEKAKPKEPKAPAVKPATGKSK